MDVTNIVQGVVHVTSNHSECKDCEMRCDVVTNSLNQSCQCDCDLSQCDQIYDEEYCDGTCHEEYQYHGYIDGCK
jgi:hypothetical protein